MFISTMMEKTLKLLLLSVFFVASGAISEEIETVCPFDYSIVKSSDDDLADDTSGTIDHRRKLEIDLTKDPLPIIKIIRQSESYVSFTVQNTTSWGLPSEQKPDQIFTNLKTDKYGSQHCYMQENMISASDTVEASCENRPDIAGPIALVNFFLRYIDDNHTTGSGDGVDIPKCCHDPYGASPSTQPSNVFVVEYLLEIKCTASCDDPEEYVPTDTITPSPILAPTYSPTASPTSIITSSPTPGPTSNPTAKATNIPTNILTLSPTSAPTSNPTAKPTNIPTLIPTSALPTNSPPRVSRSSLQEEIIKDMMPQSSSRCGNVGNGVNTTFEFQSSQAESQWNTEFVDFEQDLFLAKMQHVDINNANRSWTIRLGQAGNIYSLVGPMGETVPPQDHDQAPWIDEVWQSVQPLGPNGDNDNNPDTGPYFIHEAGTYQRDGEYTTKPFYSPSIGSYCSDEDGECGFASWGQQAHLPTPWKSPMLNFNRYVNCGNGVFEYTTLRHNNVGSEDVFGYLNVPWGGTRRSVLGDIVVTNKHTQEQTVVYPLVGWSEGANSKLKDTMGYTIFAEDLPKGANPDHDKPYPLPNGLDLTIQDPCTCEGNCRQPTHRYVCKLVTQPQNIGWVPNRGSPGQIVRLEGQDTNKSVVAGIRHWAGNGHLYFYQNDDLTLEKVREALIPGTKVNVYHYLPPEAGKPEQDNLALAHVHGGQNGAGNYPRVRYGAAGRDYNVYTINDVPNIQAGSTYYYRQYFMMDAYIEMRSKGAEWAPEAVKATKTVGTIPGRTIRLYKSQSGTASFGHTIEGDACRIQGEVVLACKGTTTPQSNSKALFQIRCGDSYVVTEDMYYFSPSGPPYRSYVCDGMDTRPEWTLLGYFPVGSCEAIGSGYQYDEQYC